MAQAAICFVGGSKSHLPFIRSAHQQGLATVVFDRNPSAPAAGLATQFHPISTHDTDSIVDTCRRAARARPIAGCITYSSDLEAMYSQAAICRELGLRGFSTEAVEITSDKHHLKRVLAGAGIPTPEHIIVTSLADLELFIARHHSVVVKPAKGGTGSAGVIRILRNRPVTRESLRTIELESADGTILVEPSLEGIEFSVDGFVQKKEPVILSTANKYTGVTTKSFAIEGFATSQQAPVEQPTKSLEELSREVVATLGIDNSFFSIDVILCNQKPFVVDVGLLLDAKIDRLLALADLDVYRILVRLATGQGLSATSCQLPNSKGFALRFLYADRAGRLCPRTPDATENSPEIEWERDEGDQVAPPGSVAETVGWLRSEREDRATAWEAVAQARSEHYFEIRE